MNLEHYNHIYKHEKNIFVRIVWYFINVIIFQSSMPFPYSFKIFILKIFGAEVGKGVVIKPSVSIKYPWLLTIGNYSWVGEDVWIDNLAKIAIKDNCCISQGAYLLTGNHDYKSRNFDLIVNSISISEGSWVGAKSIVCPGVTIGKCSVLTAGSVATSDLEDSYIYQGNPATKKKLR